MKTKIASIAAATLVACGCAAGLYFAVDAIRGDSSETAKREFCDSVGELKNTVVNYQQLDASSASISQLDAAENEIDQAFETMLGEAEDWANAYDNPLALAYDDLYWQVQFLPEDYTVAESLDAVSDELAAFPDAFDETFDNSGCSATA